MGYIYASAILMVCIVIVLVFVIIKRKNSDKLNEYKREKFADISKKTETEVKENKKVAEETKQQPQLEDFVFAEPKKEEKQEETTVSAKKPARKQALPKMPLVEEDDEEVEFDDDKVDLSEDFRKYEEFLKENNINLDELDKLDEEDEEDDAEFDDDLKDLDLKIEDFAGKTDDEIREVVKKYPPHLQEIILKELLGDDE